MTHQQAINAYATLNGMGKRVTGRVAFDLFRLKQELRTIVDFQTEEEEKLVEKCGGKVSEDGRVLIGDPEKLAEFRKGQKEMGQVECGEIRRVEIGADEIPDITLAEIEALDGFVVFK